jgi:Bacterial type II and III secretion system protein
MSHPLRTNSVAIFGVLVLMSAAVNAQDRAADDAANTEPVVLRIYHSNIPVRDLAQTLQQIARKNNVTIVSEPINNVLIVRAPQAELDEFDMLVDRLNQPARRITLSLTVYDISELSSHLDSLGTDPERVLEELRSHSEAAVHQVCKIRLTSLENQTGTVEVGEQRPVVSGESIGRSGIRTNMYQQEQLGTKLAITARVGDANQIVVELGFDMSRLDPSTGATDSVDDVLPPAKQIVSLVTTVSIPAGESVLITDFNSQKNPSNTRLVGVVSATLEQASSKTAAQRADDAMRLFDRLDQDNDGAISSEEWKQNSRILFMFEATGLDLSQPMSSEQFVQNYVRLSKPGR